MTVWVAYAKSGKEFEVQQALADLGIAAWVARKIEARRVPTKRLPVAVIAPYLANYLFLDASDDQWHIAHTVKHLTSTITPVSPKAARAYLDPFKARVDADFNTRKAAIDAGERVAEYNPGDAMTIIGGTFAGHLATFRKLAETDHDLFPRIRAEIEMFGGQISVDLDPINVRRAV